MRKNIRISLMEMIRSGAYADARYLPDEEQLSEELGIDHTQLQDALSALEEEGMITRRAGEGTLINRHVLNVRPRMDMEVEFLDMVRQSGKEAAVSFIRVMDGTADEHIASQLQIPVGTPLIRVARLITADGVPAIYCLDVVEKARVHGAPTMEDYRLPIFHFLKDFCQINPYLDLTEVRPAKADEHLSETLKVALGTPLLLMDEVDYDIDGNPVFCSLQYYRDGIIRHMVMRKKL